MSQNPNPYDLERHLAEIYDQQITETDDVELLLKLIGHRKDLRIFEPFCGTGRILIPLIRAGHRLTGLDNSAVLLERCREKLTAENLSAELIEGDAVAGHWPTGFDVVVMGGNCLYELATPEEQEACIRHAAGALNPGAYLFLDNDHMEGGLAPSWQDMRLIPSFPSGTCADGTRLESTRQVIWFSVNTRVARFKRTTRATAPDGTVIEATVIQQKHPVSTGEVREWLERHGFAIEHHYGTRAGDPYHDRLPRSIFWARKK